MRRNRHPRPFTTEAVSVNCNASERIAKFNSRLDFHDMLSAPDGTHIIRTIGTASTFLEALARYSEDDLMAMQQIQLLLQLYIHGEIAQTDLDKFTRVARSANSRNVAKLGAGERPLDKPGPGFIESFEDPRNRRTKIVRITPKGREMLEKAAMDVKPPQYQRNAGA